MPLWPMLMGDAGGGGGPTGPISLDGAAIHWVQHNVSILDSASAPVTTGPLITSLTNDLLVAVWSGSRGTAPTSTVTSVTSTSGLVWSRLGAIAGAIDSGNHNVGLEVWTAFAPAALAAEQIAFHLSSTCVCNCAGAAAFHGLVGSSGVYTLDGSVMTNLAANSGHPSVPITTVHGNDILIFAAVGGGVGSNNVPPTSFTMDVQTQDAFGFFVGTLGQSHKIVAAPQSGLVLEPASGGGTGACIGFALKGS